MTEVEPTNSVTKPSFMQQMTPTKWLIVAAVVLVVFAGLRSVFSPERMIERAIERETGGSVDIDLDGDGTVTYEGEDGEAFTVTSGESAELPAGWPSEVSIMDDATITYAGSMMGGDTNGLTAVFTVDASKAEVMDYYKTVLTESGWTVAGVMDFGDSGMVSATRGEDESAGVTVATEGGETTVTISLGLK